MTLIPAVHIAQCAEGIDQVLRFNHHELPSRQTDAFVAEGRNGCGINIFTKVPCQSRRNLQRKTNFVSVVKSTKNLAEFRVKVRNDFVKVNLTHTNIIGI